MNLSHRTSSSKNILDKALKKFCSEGKNIFYLDELVDEANVSLREAEDFLILLLKKGKIEGRLEVRCPICGRDQGEFKRLSEIPEEIVCEICQHDFHRAAEYIQIVLEVKEEFFRDQKCTSDINRKDSHERRIVSVAE